MIRVSWDNLEHFKVIKISNILVSSVETTKKVKIPTEKETLAYRAPLKFCFGFVHYAFGFVYKVRGRLSFFSSFKDVLMLKSPPFSKSSLNLVQFDGRFIGICKNLL